MSATNWLGQAIAATKAAVDFETSNAILEAQAKLLKVLPVRNLSVVEAEVERRTEMFEQLRATSTVRTRGTRLHPTVAAIDSVVDDITSGRLA